MKSSKKNFFKTDREIGSSSFKKRNLKKWQNEDKTKEFSLSEDKKEKWDQFQANKDLFGIQLSFNENEYTIPINKESTEYKTEMEKIEMKPHEQKEFLKVDYENREEDLKKMDIEKKLQKLDPDALPFFSTGLF